MKLAKKTISVALAGIMAVSSLAVGTSVFAADNKVNELKSSTKASATFKCDTNKSDSKKYDQTVTLYSFKPSESGLYDVSLSSTPYVLTADAYIDPDNNPQTDNNVKAFSKGDRLDNASLVLFTAADDKAASNVADAFLANQNTTVANSLVKFVKDSVANTKDSGKKTHNAGSYYHVATGYTTSTNGTTELTFTDLAQTTQVSLNKNTTYYVAAVADSYDRYERSVDSSIVIGSQEKGLSTTGTVSISKADWKYDKKATVEKTVPNSTDKYYDLKTSVEYVGESNSIVMPDEYPASYKAVTITGTANKNVTSVKLGKNCENMNLVVTGCRKLTTFTYNDLVKTIGAGTFKGCTALKSIVIPKSVESIGDEAFSGCVNLASITLNEGLKTVGYRAFYDTAALAVKVPSTVTSIGTEAFGFIEADNDFFVDPYNHAYLTIVNPKFVLGGTTFVAQNWAKKSDVPYVDLTNGCSHHYISYVKTAATFFSTGSIVKACGFCGVSTTQTIAKTKPAIKSVKSTGKGKIKVTTVKTAGVSGYQIKVSTSKKFTKKTTKVVTVKERDRLLKTVKGLKSGKKVYVKIRAYKKNGSTKTYSAFSPVKTVKVK